MVLFRLLENVSIHTLILISRLLLCLCRKLMTLRLLLLLLETAREVRRLIKSFLVALCRISHEVGTIGEWNLLWLRLWLCHLWINWHVGWFIQTLHHFILHSFLLLLLLCRCLLLLLLTCLVNLLYLSRHSCVGLLIFFSSLVSCFF